MFKIGDKVVVIAGNSKGKEGKVLKVLRDKDRIIVEGCNIIKKHQKSDGVNTGGIVETEAPIHISNVMHIDPKTKKRTRISMSIDKNGKKQRLSKKSSEVIG